jgi:hypothetical protein
MFVDMKERINMGRLIEPPSDVGNLYNKETLIAMVSC